MKNAPLILLAGLCAAQGVLLAWLWVTPQGQLREAVRWRAPAALEADYAAMGPALPAAGEAGLRHPATLLDRPLFSMTRRPPEPVAAAQALLAPDRLSTARMRAIVDGPDSASSIILEVDGKSHRIHKQRAFEGWTLESLDPQARTVTMARNGHKRVLSLQRGQLTTANARQRPGSASMPTGRPAAPSVSTGRAASGRESALSPAQTTEPAANAPSAPPPPATAGGMQR